MLYSKLSPEQLDKRLLSALKYTDVQIDHQRPQNWRAAIYEAATLPSKWVRRVR